MFISIDLPDDLVKAVDERVRKRLAEYRKEKTAVAEASKPVAPQPLTHREKHHMAVIAQKEGGAAATAWLKAQRSKGKPQEAEEKRSAGRPRECPSRRLLIEELLRVGLSETEG